MPPKKTSKRVSKPKAVQVESVEEPVMGVAVHVEVPVVSAPRGEVSVITGSNGGVVGPDTREQGVVIR